MADSESSRWRPRFASSRRSDKAERRVEDAGRKSPATSHRVGGIPQAWVEGERQLGSQPSVEDTSGNGLDSGLGRARKLVKQILRTDKHGSTEEVEGMETTPPHQPIEEAKEQSGEFSAEWPLEIDVGDVMVAKYDFTARSSDELTLIKGDPIEVIEKDDEFGDGWLLGKNLTNGNCGLFPQAYISRGGKVPDAPAVSMDQFTVQKELEAQGLNPDSDPSSDIVEVDVAGNSPGPVCSSCGARWDPEFGCSRSCHGKQDDLSDQESVYSDQESAASRYPKKGKTRIPSRLVSKRALIDLGYPFVEEGKTIIVEKALGQENIDDLLKLSEEYKRSDLEVDGARSPSGTQADADQNKSYSEPIATNPSWGWSDPIPYSSSRSRPGSPYDTYDTASVASSELPSTPARSVIGWSNSESSEEATAFNSYSAVFSEGSRQQPTDPSSWLESFSADRADPRAHPADVAQEFEDCSQSVSSVADSIGSAVSTGGSLGQAGVNYVVAKFTQSDPELLALYTEASQRMTKDRFVENNRRLLKMFYLDFSREEKTPSQKEALAFLRSRRRRAEISSDIFRTVTPDNEIVLSAEKDKEELSMLNAYFETLDAADAARDKDDEEDGERIDTDDSEVEHEVKDPPLLDMKSLQAIGEYFVTSRAFSQYKVRLHLFLHPDHQKENESTGSQGIESEPKQNRGDKSRAVQPENERGDQLFTDTVMEHPLDDHKEETKSQAEDSPAEQESKSGDIREPHLQSPQAPVHPMPWERDSLATWGRKLVTDILWPPSKGSQRIWYFCGCGEYSYMDVKEREYGGVETEWRSISESSAAVRRAHTPSNSASASGQLPMAPPPVHLGPASPSNAASQNSSAQAPPHTPQADLNPTTAVSPTPAGNTPRDPLFLLICVNGKAYKTLAELRCLGIDDSYNDELLVKGILDAYEQTRKGQQWTLDLLLPTWVLPASLIQHLKRPWKVIPAYVWKPSFIRDSALAQSTSEWWSKYACNISPWAPLHIIDTADFVEFELVPHPEGKEAFPSHFTSGCWPQPDDKQYRYRPVPMKCIKTMNLWHMRLPGPHTEVYWYNTVPKKVDGPLYRPSGAVEEVVGYGVRINEKLNDVFVIWWSFTFILATGAFVYIYSHYSGDNSSAFGLGAYLVAAFTVYIQLQYALWKRI